MADQKISQNIFGRVAGRVDDFFQTKFYTLGLFVGTRPCTSIMVSLGICFALMGGFSQIASESRAEKLWIPQDTQAQADQRVYASHFPPTTRVNQLVLEARSGSVLDKAFLQGAVALHDEIEAIQAPGGGLRDLCVPRPNDGHPCFISSVLGVWSYNSSVLSADADPLTTLNSAGKTSDELRSMLGGLTFSGTGSDVQSAQAMMLTYFLKNDREEESDGYDNLEATEWEEELLTVLGCDAPVCEGDDVCACGYDSAHFKVFARAERSFSDAFGGVIRGDVGLINGAFFIMIIYLVLNLGGLCHKVQSRALLACGCVLSIVVAGAAGYGLAAWLQFAYTPAHGVLPFVILGIGVDDSFVIMNAFDRTDSSLSVPKRIAAAISHAGVSIMVTSLTDFVAFAISVSSALPALSSFCMYAAFSVLALFALQIFFFGALATLDARRVAAGRVDCFPCVARGRGCPCCPAAPQEEALAAVERGEKDPNQLCCVPPAHKGGRIGRFMENVFGPLLVRPAAIAAAVVISAGFCGICAWQASQLAVQDTQRNFIPDDSYVASALNKVDQYFGENGQSVDIVTLAGDYHASQTGLASISTKLQELDFVKPAAPGSFRSWAEAFKDACVAGAVPQCDTTTGLVAVDSEYYNALAVWLQGAGARYSGDVVFVDPADPQQGIKASRFTAELAPMNRVVGGRIVVDSDRAIQVMDGLREACDSWNDLPGGRAMPYTYTFLSWETFRIIKREMFVSVSLCLAAVFIIALALLAHPLTAVLVFLAVVMTVVDILGCMNMWGLAIDNVSVIQLVISVGLCIDYAAHVGHNFMLHQGSRSQRVVATLGDVGSAVICGAISTFLGVMLLALSKSYVFRVLFQTFFLTVILGVAHGLILLPALLAAVGPESYKGPATVVEEMAAAKAGGAAADNSEEAVPSAEMIGA